MLTRRLLSRNILLRAAAPLVLLSLTGCHRYQFPTYPSNYHEFAYVSNGNAGTVTVLDLVYLRQDRVLQVGRQPTGEAVNPVRNEVYVANAASDSISIIDAETNRVAYTLAVHHAPYSIEIAPDGHRAYVPNSGSNTISVLNLDTRREIAAAATGEGPGTARVSADNRTLVVSNRISGSVSVYSISPGNQPGSSDHPLQLRAAFPGCTGATDVALNNDINSPKAFIACSGAHQVMVLWLAVPADSYRGKQDPSLTQDHLLTLLDVGQTPTHLALKPDGGELFVTNFDSDSLSEISTWTNEVLGTYVVGSKPSRALFSRDNSSLWFTNFGADSAGLYSVDDGHVEASLRTGPHPDAIAFSADEHLLLVADSASADVAVIRTQNKNGPTLFTMLPAGEHPNDLVVKAFRGK